MPKLHTVPNHGCNRLASPPRIPVILPHAATTAVPGVPSTRTAGWCPNAAPEEAVGETSVLEASRAGRSHGMAVVGSGR